ncbi:hypothetical protein C4D60_Mb06t25870 [Musa balbisiana]|uniref:Uncharacterized protein n=1 Tax=Musa balbisiana TaxID=52838 RepID=A0A4S8IQP7_MUSBA|nr:hypothetical protein C4D60_Mb06t25870 [Musa balbisiana]
MEIALRRPPLLLDCFSMVLITGEAMPCSSQRNVEPTRRTPCFDSRQGRWRKGTYKNAGVGQNDAVVGVDADISSVSVGEEPVE